jgi:hypothetical protein
VGTYDITLHTAVCDVGDCEEMYGDPEDFGWDWSEFSSEAEEIAIRQGGWTRIDRTLICKTDDNEHNEARGHWPDTRPKPGPGQLAINLKDAT